VKIQLSLTARILYRVRVRVKTTAVHGEIPPDALSISSEWIIVSMYRVAGRVSGLFTTPKRLDGVYAPFASNYSNRDGSTIDRAFSDRLPRVSQLIKISSVPTICCVTGRAQFPGFSMKMSLEMASQVVEKWSVK